MTTPRLPTRSLPAVRDPRAAGPVLRSSLTPAEEKQEGIPFAEYLAALRRYLWLIAACMALSLGYAVYKLAKALPTYVASTSIRLVDTRVGMSGDLEQTGSSSDQLPGFYMDPILSQIQVLRSRAVLGQVVDSLGLRLSPLDPTFAWGVLERVRVNSAARNGDTVTVRFDEGGVTSRMRGVTARAPYGAPLHLPGVEMVFSGRAASAAETFVIVPQGDVVGAVSGRLQVSPREMTNIVDIAYLAHDPTLAQRVANAAAASFQEFSTEAARQSSRRRRVFIQEQLRSTDALLATAQLQLSAFRRRVGSMSPRDKFRTTEEGMGALLLRRSELEQEKQLYDRVHGALRASNGPEALNQVAALVASPQAGNNRGMVDLYEQFLRFQTIRDSVTTGPWSSSSSNPDVQRLDSMILTSRTRLMQAAAGRSTALAAQIGVIQSLASSDTATMAALPDAEAEEQRLGRRVATLQTLADDLLREQQKARIDEAVQVGQVEIVDPAVVPGGPMGKGTGKRLAFALVLGLALGAGVALSLDRVNGSILRRDEMESLLNLPVLGITPRVQRQGGGAGWTSRLNLSRQVRGGVPPAGPHSLAADAQSPAAQAYWKLRTHLLFAVSNTPQRVLMVTSAEAAEGKSTVAANLALSFAQQGVQVLLVDGDARRARQHRIFRVERSPGVSEVLAGLAGFDDAVQPTNMPGLSVLPAGLFVPNITDLLEREMAERVLAEAVRRFDFVIVDTPPVAAAADAEILSAHADAVLLVVRAGQTDRRAAQHAVQQLRAVGARLVGGVLNDPDEKTEGYSSYKYYAGYRDDD
jgi:capsular exopolysaccharide synthesis family protein